MKEIYRMPVQPPDRTGFDRLGSGMHGSSGITVKDYSPQRHSPRGIAARYSTGQARQSRDQSSNRYFTTEARSSQRSEYFLIKNSLLRVLSVLRQAQDRLSPRCNLRIFPHHRDTEFAEFGEFLKQKIFTRRPQRLRGVISESFH